MTNILFLMTDQHRVDTLGCYGNERISTPNLDALAAAGTRFDRAYTPTTICTPARASLLTGYAPFRHKLLANYERNVGFAEELEPDQFTFSEALRKAGYNCGLIGKWHVGTKRTAADYGFDGPHLPGWHNPVGHPDYLGYLEHRGLPGYAIEDEIRGRFPNRERGNLIAARLRQPTEATFEHYLADRAIELLRRYQSEDKPFFLATHFFGPHLPYLLPDEFFDMYDPDDIELPASVAETFANKPPVQRNYSAHWAFDTFSEAQSRKIIAAYWGYVTLIDQQIGRILDAARELDTAVFFTADHGEFTGAHRLHDKGPAMYEDTYRIPLLLKVPGGPENQVNEDFTSLLDCTATILDLAGADTVRAVDSRSLLPLIRNEETAWRDHVICEFHGHHFAHPQRMIRDERYKLIVNPESVNELYDLRTDPHELQNRYQHPELRAPRDRLLAQLYRALRERGDNFHHWMSTMYEVGGLDYDPTQSSFEDT